MGGIGWQQAHQQELHAQAATPACTSAGMCMQQIRANGPAQNQTGCTCWSGLNARLSTVVVRFMSAFSGGRNPGGAAAAAAAATPVFGSPGGRQHLCHHDTSSPCIGIYYL